MKTKKKPAPRSDIEWGTSRITYKNVKGRMIWMCPVCGHEHEQKSGMDKHTFDKITPLR